MRTEQSRINRCVSTVHFIPARVHVCACADPFVCVCACVFGPVSVCVFTFTSHVNAAGVSSSVPGHVTDTCRRRVQQRRASNRSLSRHEAPSPLSLSLLLTHSLTHSYPSLTTLSSVRSSSPALPGPSLAPTQPRTRSQGTGCTLQRSHGLWCAFVTCGQCCSSSARARLTSRSADNTTTTTQQPQSPLSPLAPLLPNDHGGGLLITALS